MLDLIRRYAALYLVEILGFCLMGNHFHILVSKKLGVIKNWEKIGGQKNWGSNLD